MQVFSIFSNIFRADVRPLFPHASTRRPFRLADELLASILLENTETPQEVMFV